MKIGILYICTGKYVSFWDGFYESSQKYFMVDPDLEKHYFVFTDSQDIKASPFIHTYFKTSEGFPADSIGRFDMFLSIEEDLKSMDFVFFFNSNMLFLDHVGREILPLDNQSGLTGTLHPGYYNVSKEKFPYERDPRSTAYIPNIEGVKYHYFMGGLNGGRTTNFMTLCRDCSANIKLDEKNNIIACFHDESHINAYFLQKDVLIMPSSYGFPEGLEFPFAVKILIRDKVKHYGEDFRKEYANPFLLPSPFKRKGLWGRFVSSLQKNHQKLFNK